MHLEIFFSVTGVIKPTITPWVGWVEVPISLWETFSETTWIHILTYTYSTALKVLLDPLDNEVRLPTWIYVSEDLNRWGKSLPGKATQQYLTKVPFKQFLIVRGGIRGWSTWSLWIGQNGQSGKGEQPTQGKVYFYSDTPLYWAFSALLIGLKVQDSEGESF